MTSKDETAWEEFHQHVNLTAGDLEKWLKTGESKDVGHVHMRKVAGYVKRHLAHRPSGDVHDTAWRYSLMNWGHDPIRK